MLIRCTHTFGVYTFSVHTSLRAGLIREKAKLNTASELNHKGYVGGSSIYDYMVTILHD